MTFVKFPMAADELDSLTTQTRNELIEDHFNSPAARTLRSGNQFIEWICHRYTVENKPPGDVGPEVYDWSERFPQYGAIKRNNFEQTVQSSGQIYLIIPVDEAVTLNWRGLVLHLAVAITDLHTNHTAYFHFGSYTVVDHARCAELEPNEFTDSYVYEVMIADRISVLDIQNDIRWDVPLIPGWTLAREVNRIINRPTDNPWPAIDGIRHNVSFIIEESELQLQTHENPYRQTEDSRSWLEIIADLAHLDSFRGHLPYADETGQFRITRFSESAIPTPIWTFDDDATDTTIVGQPQVEEQDIYNQPNRWVVIGDPALGGDSAVVRSRDVYRDQDGIRESGRLITQILRMESRDQSKLDQYAAHAMHCTLADRFQIHFKTVPIPHLWHNAPVNVISEKIFGDRQPRLFTVSEFTMPLDGNTPMNVTLRSIPTIRRV